jgi:hypothetical protein
MPGRSLIISAAISRPPVSTNSQPETPEAKLPVAQFDRGSCTRGYGTPNYNQHSLDCTLVHMPAVRLFLREATLAEVPVVISLLASSVVKAHSCSLNTRTNVTHAKFRQSPGKCLNFLTGSALQVASKEF